MVRKQFMQIESQVLSWLYLCLNTSTEGFDIKLPRLAQPLFDLKGGGLASQMFLESNYDSVTISQQQLQFVAGVWLQRTRSL
jgi:hypothetical protein